MQTAVSPAWQLTDGHSVFLAVKHLTLLQQMNRAIFFLRDPAQVIQTAHDGIFVTRLEMAQVDAKTALLQVLTDILRKAVRRVVPCQVGEGLVSSLAKVHSVTSQRKRCPLFGNPLMYCHSKGLRPVSPVNSQVSP